MGVDGRLKLQPYVGKIWLEKELANLTNRTPFTSVLFANYFLLYSVVAIRAVHSPIIYSPIGPD